MRRLGVSLLLVVPFPLVAVAMSPDDWKTVAAAVSVFAALGLFKAAKWVGVIVIEKISDLLCEKLSKKFEKQAGEIDQLRADMETLLRLVPVAVADRRREPCPEPPPETGERRAELRRMRRSQPVALPLEGGEG